MRSLWIGLLGVALFGCSSSGTEPVASAPQDVLSFQTGEFEIPDGDSFTCFYSNVITDRELAILSADGFQQEGGHHITVYYVDKPQKVDHHTCSDSEMVSWHQIAGANGEGTKEPVVQLPDGVATKIAKGKQIAVQIHYINTSGKPRMVNDSVNVHYTDPANVKVFANNFVINNPYFTVPAAGTTTSRGTCVVPQDLTLLLLLGHQHEHGKHFKLEEVDEAGKVLTTLYDHDWEPQFASHPPVNLYTMEKPLLLKKGTRLRQTCDWSNDTTDPLKFPREMCVMFSMYVPDAGEFDCDFTPEPTP
jgi:hypothetical protein